MKTGYKLFRKRRDGTYGPLFINKDLRLMPGEWYDAEFHPTKGFAERQGWHIMAKPVAPHLTERNRVWCMVRFSNWKPFTRPVNQGGQWYLAQRMKIVSELV